MKSASKHEEILFFAGKQTAFGTFGGTLKDLSATDLGVGRACMGGGQGIAVLVEAM